MTHHNIDDMVYDMTRARAQAVSDVQAENEERRRRQRVEEENRAAYDEARAAERNRRGGAVSSMNQWGPDGSAASSFSNTAIGTDGSVQREGFGDAWGLQARVGSEFADLARRSAMAQRHNAQIGTDSLSAAMRAAMANGGRLPQNLVGMLSRNLGLDGKSASVFSAGYLNNGDFDIDIVTRGANGGLQRTTKKISPREQLGIVNSTPGVWGNDGLAVSQRLYDGLRNTMGKSELPPQGVYAENLRAYNTQMQAQTSQKDMLSAMKMLIDYEQKSKAPMSAEQFLRTMPKSVLEMVFPPRYEEGSDPNDPERPTKPYTPQEIAERTNEIMASLRSRASGNDGERSDPVRDTLIAGLRKLSGLDAPQVPDDIRDFQQRQRERQMRQVEEAQAREDITRRPQQVINYFKDGKWYSGNGYVRDGKVYDGQGYEIEGATPAEMARGADGGVYSNERGWVARALPSARELVSGRGGAEQRAQQAQQPAHGTQGAQQQPAQAHGAPQQAAQGGATSATSDIDVKKKQLATMEAELRRRQSVSKMAQEIDSQRNASLEGPRVGKTDDGDYVSSAVGGVKLDMNSIPRNDKDAEENLRKNELAIVKRISGRGGDVWHDEDGGVHARIGNFEYLPKDEQEKYRDGIVSGLPLDSIDDIQRRADVAAKDVAARREKNLQRLRSEARGKFQTEGERIAYVNKKDKEWRIENDPAFKDPDRAARTEASAQSNLMTFFP